ncbi:coiled-coil domain-containing protein 115-like [Antechinus flavipes]|uniref:coiled-coil domain-containing protein 115-like n=1 Tax=Antechinus flavipes TaxID=38775 RepID=UPI002235C326|nr:coiled-coil domain-containing protein 115-like [Antechinus flavipes]
MAETAAGSKPSPTPAAPAAGALQALCTQLDDHVVQLFLELEQLEGKRAELNARVEEGWFSLSKTRYAMGAKAVSPLQYSSSMAPLFRVCANEPEPGRPEFEVVFTKVGSPKESSPKEDQGVIDGEPKSESPVLRRRQQSHASPPQPTPPTPATETSVEQDPLTWFGILVPQSLRQAQGSFRAALLIAGEIAGLQSRIEWERAQIQALLQEKRKLLEQMMVE